MLSSRRSIVIIGGGASGVIMAAHLLRSDDPDLRVTLVEKRDEVGKGLAYSTRNPEHRLNVIAGRMSAYADEPMHFWHWLRAARPLRYADADVFASRADYGHYLAEIFAGLLRREAGSGRLHRVQDACIDIEPTGSGADVRLAGGGSIPAHVVILATGHETRATSRWAIRPSGDPDDDPPRPDEPVVILGSGLSMIDRFLSLWTAGHSGPITVVSRRGLLPLPHGARRNPIRLDSADIPFGTGLAYFVRWFTGLIKATEQRGGNWRDVIDGLRPFNQQIWRDWTPEARRRFLAHTKPWWDVHRHRVATDIHARLQGAVASGQVSLVAGKIVSVVSDGQGFEVTLRRRGAASAETIRCGRLYDCTGVVRDLAASAPPPVSALIDRGLARTDALRIGLDADADGALIDARGRRSERIFAIGPLTRGALFEIDAVPDIRVHCAALAADIVGRVHQRA